MMFAPCYTPPEMLQAGVFEGKYINMIEGLPSSWYKLPTVVQPDAPPDVSLNKFGVKSRQPLSTWEENGWIYTDAGGWFHWYCNYFLGRRLDIEDDFQIKRWRSFVARHQGQIVNSGFLKAKTKRIRQRQGLLQWAWDSTRPFNERTRSNNLRRLQTLPQVKTK
jgi:hypothetical protein